MANQVSNDNGRSSLFNGHRNAIVAYSDPYGLFAEVISQGKEYHNCNGSCMSSMMKKVMRYGG